MFTLISFVQPTISRLAVIGKLERDFGLRVRHKSLDFHGDELKEYHFSEIVTRTSTLTDLKPDFSKSHQSEYDEWTPNGLLIAYEGPESDKFSVYLFEAEKVETAQPA